MGRKVKIRNEEKDDPMTEKNFTLLASTIEPPSEAAAEAARALHNQLTKPPGSLGFVDTLGVQLCAIARHCPPPVPEPVTIAVFAGDHGVVEAGVTPWPS